MTKLACLYLSGHVRRWHHNPMMAHTDQTNADHQGRCVMLLLALHPRPSPALIQAVATHDVGEFWVGDLGHEFKCQYPEIAERHARAERDARQDICGPDPNLTPEEQELAKLIDRLESACWCITRNRQEYDRPGSGWAEI